MKFQFLNKCVICSGIYVCIYLFFWYIQALQEISVEDRKRQLENSKSELNAIEKRIEEVNHEFKSVEKKVQEALKMVSFIRC